MSIGRLDASTAHDEDAGETAPFTHTVHHNGCVYRVTEEMAGIFLRRARAILATAGAELVPLSHVSGVDLLLITDGIPWSVTEVDVGVVQPSTPRKRALRAVS